MKLQRNLSKILPAVTAIGALCVTSAFAFGSHGGNPGGGGSGGATAGQQNLNPTVCGDLADGNATFVQIHGGGTALELFSTDDDAIPYGKVQPASTGTSWQSINFDVNATDDANVLHVTCTNPSGNIATQGIFLTDLPATTAHNNSSFSTLTATAAYLAVNRGFGVGFLNGAFFNGAVFRNACIAQFPSGGTLYVQNVQVNGGHAAVNQMVAANEDCTTLFP